MYQVITIQVIYQIIDITHRYWAYFYQKMYIKEQKYILSFSRNRKTFGLWDLWVAPWQWNIKYENPHNTTFHYQGLTTYKYLLYCSATIFRWIWDYDKVKEKKKNKNKIWLHSYPRISHRSDRSQVIYSWYWAVDKVEVTKRITII